jgi:hypothetical protein
VPLGFIVFLFPFLLSCTDHIFFFVEMQADQLSPDVLCQCFMEISHGHVVFWMYIKHLIQLYLQGGQDS